MPGGRPYTSYEVYRDYTNPGDTWDMYPEPIEGVYTPTPPTPVDGRLSPSRSLSRSKSRLRTPGRPASRMDIGVQTEKKPRPQISETQYNYAIPDETVRPTSPVQRLLERWHTQPNMTQSGPIPGSEMDPITRQYYYRMWKGQVPQSDNVHLNRYGRAGGVWRHVRACVANTGTQLAFIDGTVKEEDNVYFPPWRKSAPAGGGLQRQNNYTYYPPGNQISANFVPATYRSAPKSSTYRNKFHTHAKEGFKYWYQEPKPIELKMRELARRRLMMDRANKAASMATLRS